MTEMFDNPRTFRADVDTEAHGWRMSADADTTEGDDTEGHRMWSDRNVKEDIYPVDHGDDDVEGHDKKLKADAEATEGDHTEGHRAYSNRADAETAEGDDDTEGHGFRGNRADAEAVEGDGDTEGHRFYSDRTLKVDVEPIDHGDDDTEGDDNVEGDMPFGRGANAQATTIWEATQAPGNSRS